MMSKILIPEEVPELIKRNMKPLSLKRGSLSFVWPIGSKEFENHFPNVSKNDVKKIHTILENDDEFKNLLKVAFKDSKERKYEDVYQYKYDRIHLKIDKCQFMMPPNTKMMFAERFRVPDSLKMPQIGSSLLS